MSCGHTTHSPLHAANKLPSSVKDLMICTFILGNCIAHCFKILGLLYYFTAIIISNTNEDVNIKCTYNEHIIKILYIPGKR